MTESSRVCAVTNCDDTEVVGMELIPGDLSTIILLCLSHAQMLDELRRRQQSAAIVPHGDDSGTG